MIILDEYLIPNKSLQRLLDEYQKYGSLTIGFDFDGTVYDYHKTGSTYNMVIKLLKDLYSIGCKLVCWTANEDLSYVADYLRDRDIPFESINEGAIPLPWESRKLFFSALLDDRAGLQQVYQELSMLVYLVKQK